MKQRIQKALTQPLGCTSYCMLCAISPDKLGRVASGRASGYKILPNQIMRITKPISIPDQLWSGLMTASGAVGQQGISGNSGTVEPRMNRKREGSSVRRCQESEKVEIRIGTLNVGTKMGRGRELVDMERRKVDVFCEQEKVEGKQG